MYPCNVLVASFTGLGEERAPDPSGTNTGNAFDVPAVAPGQPTAAEIADTVGHNKVAINIMWTLITGFLVMFMQAGLPWLRPAFVGLRA